jgi:hypothetical protein
MKDSPLLIFSTARERCSANTLTPGISTGPEVDMHVHVAKEFYMYVHHDTKNLLYNIDMYMCVAQRKTCMYEARDPYVHFYY